MWPEVLPHLFPFSVPPFLPEGGVGKGHEVIVNRQTLGTFVFKRNKDRLVAPSLCELGVEVIIIPCSNAVSVVHGQ